jgi:hypothetical protein
MVTLGIEDVDWATGEAWVLNEANAGGVQISSTPA